MQCAILTHGETELLKRLRDHFVVQDWDLSSRTHSALFAQPELPLTTLACLSSWVKVDSLWRSQKGSPLLATFPNKKYQAAAPCHLSKDSLYGLTYLFRVRTYFCLLKPALYCAKAEILVLSSNTVEVPDSGSCRFCEHSKMYAMSPTSGAQSDGSPGANYLRLCLAL